MNTAKVSQAIEEVQESEFHPKLIGVWVLMGGTSRQLLVITKDQALGLLKKFKPDYEIPFYTDDERIEIGT